MQHLNREIIFFNLHSSEYIIGMHEKDRNSIFKTGSNG